MLIVRGEQMAAFEQGADRRFIERTMAYVLDCFAEETATLGQEALRGLARKALAAAKRFQLSSERDARYYINLSVMFGEDFIDREENRWMLEFLTDPEVPRPGERIHRLYQAVIKKLRNDANRRRIEERFKRRGG